MTRAVFHACCGRRTQLGHKPSCTENSARYAAARAVKGWSLADAAAYLGTDEFTYARMERAPTPAQRVALVNLYGPVMKRLAKDERR